MTTQIKSVDFDSVDSKFPPSIAQYGKMHMVEFGTGSDGIKRTCAKVVAKKGFQWTEHMPASKGGPMPEGVTCCPKAHFGYLEEGEMKVIMVETGEEKVVKAGEAYVIPPKHDAVMLTDVVMIEFESEAAEFYGSMK